MRGGLYRIYVALVKESEKKLMIMNVLNSMASPKARALPVNKTGSSFDNIHTSSCITADDVRVDELV